VPPGPMRTRTAPESHAPQAHPPSTPTRTTNRRSPVAWPEIIPRSSLFTSLRGRVLLRSSPGKVAKVVRLSLQGI
jgi:hypothetical protein